MQRNTYILLLAAATIATVALAKAQVNTASVTSAAAASAITPQSNVGFQQHTPFSGQITDYGYGGGTGSSSSLLRPGPIASAIDLSQMSLGEITHTDGVAIGAQEIVYGYGSGSGSYYPTYSGPARLPVP
jgi:hypothetical protein